MVKSKLITLSPSALCDSGFGSPGPGLRIQCVITASASRFDRVLVCSAINCQDRMVKMFPVVLANFNWCYPEYEMD